MTLAVIVRRLVADRPAKLQSLLWSRAAMKVTKRNGRGVASRGRLLSIQTP